MPDSPVDPIAQLARQLKKAVEEVGLSLGHFSLAPDLDGTDHHVQATFFLGPEPPTADDKAFEDILAAQQEHEREQKVIEERQSLEHLRDELKDKKRGIGLDDDD